MMKNLVQKEAAKYLDTANKWDSLTKIQGRVLKNDLPDGILAKDVKNEISRIFDIRQMRAGKKRRLEALRDHSIEARIRRVFKGKPISKMAKHLPDDCYSMGSFFSIKIKGWTVDSYSTATEYAKSYGFPAKHGSVTLYLSPKEAMAARLIGGMITIPGDLVGRGVRKAKWVTSEGHKQHFKLLLGEGYLAGDYHFSAKNDKEARATARRYYKGRRLIEAKVKKHRGAMRRSNLRTWVSIEDSLRGGNCEYGTMNFCKSIRFDPEKLGAIRADWLLKLSEKKNVSHFVTKAMDAAKLRYAGL